MPADRYVCSAANDSKNNSIESIRCTQLLLCLTKWQRVLCVCRVGGGSPRLPTPADRQAGSADSMTSR